jgi:DNA helicase-2/ATP-dependent DNA helicase PcrA
VQISDTTKDRIQSYIIDKTDFKKIYFDFINNRKYNSKEISEYTAKTYTRNTFTQEDLPALLWINFKLNGLNDHLKDYIVVDEAQDMSPFELYILNMISKKSNLFLAGDIAQSIIPPFLIQSWDTVKEMNEKRLDIKFQYHQLNRCYRTTIEIIEYANNILKLYFPKEYVLPEAVLRHGDDVKEIEIKDLKKTINEQFTKGSSTVALVCKDEEDSNILFERLKLIENELDRPLYTYSDSDYKTGILVLPVSKAKGLEFDSVVLVNTKKYNMDVQSDCRLFYVGVTRALHRLFILKEL